MPTELTGQKIKSFTDLHAWQESHRLVLMIYEITKQFPKEEMFGLTSQMRRCAISIVSNIAEGFSRQSTREKLQFYSIAHGSTTELQSQLIIARDISYLDSKKFETIAQQIIVAHKLLNGLRRHLKNDEY